jgi:hypothetical protein
MDTPGKSPRPSASCGPNGITLSDEGDRRERARSRSVLSGVKID